MWLRSLVLPLLSFCSGQYLHQDADSVSQDGKKRLGPIHWLPFFPSFRFSMNPSYLFCFSGSFANGLKSLGPIAANWVPNCHFCGTLCKVGVCDWFGTGCWGSTEGFICCSACCFTPLILSLSLSDRYSRTEAVGPNKGKKNHKVQHSD